MRWLRKVWQDVSENRNIELYLTITIAVVIGILGAFSVVDMEVVAALILATLALLALGTLNLTGNNTRFERGRVHLLAYPG
jgi:hypothetical protein